MTEVTKTLDAKYYIDPKYFDVEQKKLFSKTWQFACHASEIPLPGSYKTFEIAGEQLVAVRDKHKEVRVFYNVCQHRAHQLLEGMGQKTSIVCPYHGWAYNLDGKFLGGPNIKSVLGLNKNSICLNEVRVEEFLDFIFINLDPNTKTMDEWFPRVREELLEWIPHWQKLQPLEWVEVSERCNWKISVENYNECYHCSINHPTFANGVIDPKSYNIKPQGKSLRHTTRCQNLEKMTYNIESQYKHYDEYSSWFLWPMFSFQVYPGNILNTYHWRTIDTNNVILWRGWYSVEGKENETIRKLAKQDRETTVEEDIGLVESVHQGLNSKGYKGGPLVIDPKEGVHSEHSVMYLQQWLKEAINDI